MMESPSISSLQISDLTEALRRAGRLAGYDACHGTTLQPELLVAQVVMTSPLELRNYPLRSIR